jgi:hypothetical protein
LVDDGAGHFVGIVSLETSATKLSGRVVLVLFVKGGHPYQTKSKQTDQPTWSEFLMDKQGVNLMRMLRNNARKKMLTIGCCLDV